MENLKITVLGRPNSGKTTVTRFIEKALKEAGFTDVTVKDSLDPIRQNIDTLVSHIKDRPILIETVQANRKQEIK